MAVPVLTSGVHNFTAPNGITFNYTVSGSGPLVVFQSVGWGPSIQLYKSSMQPLESDLTMLYFQARGSGDSSRPSSPDEMSTKDMASDLEHLRQHLGLEKITLMGHSNGAAISLTYAEEFPERVEKLVLVDGELQGFSSDNFQKVAAARMTHPVYGPALQSIMELMKTPPATDEEFVVGLKKVVPYYFTDTDKSYMLADAVAAGNLSVWAFQNQSRCDRNLKFNAVEGLGKVQARTLVINGEEDAMCSLASAEAAVEGIGKRATLEVVKDCGHCPWMEKPEIFYPVVKAFLKEIV